MKENKCKNNVKLGETECGKKNKGNSEEGVRKY